MAKKTEIITIQCDSDEKAWVYTMAHAQYMSMSELIRRLIKKAFDEYRDNLARKELSEKLGHPAEPKPTKPTKDERNALIAKLNSDYFSDDVDLGLDDDDDDAADWDDEGDDL